MRKSRRPAGTSPLILVPAVEARGDLDLPRRRNDLVVPAVAAAADVAVAATTATDAAPRAAGCKRDKREKYGQPARRKATRSFSVLRFLACRTDVLRVTIIAARQRLRPWHYCCGKKTKKKYPVTTAGIHHTFLGRTKTVGLRVGVVKGQKRSVPHLAHIMIYYIYIYIYISDLSASVCR